MTGDLYDHLLAVIVVGVLFLTAVIATPNISYVNLLHLDQQQLRNIGLAAFKTMLLDAGYPPNWGSSGNFTQNSVERFGLALDESSSLYVLDPDKVQRLVVDNPMGYLEYERVRQLLGLEGYGFNIKITAPFNVTITDQSVGINLEYKVKVKYADNKPVPNALVKAIILISKFDGLEGQNESYSIQSIQLTGYTNELGECTIQYRITESYSDLVVIFQISVADVTTVTTILNEERMNDIAEVNIVNDTAILTHPGVTPPDARFVLNVETFTEDGLVLLYDGTFSDEDVLNYGAKNVWSKLFSGLKSINPILMIFNIYAVEEGVGKKGFLLVGPYPNYAGVRVIGYGYGSGVSNDNSVKLQRAVSISGMTYIVELTLWKE